jgi:hypothetical protein
LTQIKDGASQLAEHDREFAGRRYRAITVEAVEFGSCAPDRAIRQPLLFHQLESGASG